MSKLIHMSSGEALKRLKDGNARFSQGLRSIDSLCSSQRLAELAESGQKPFCMILACADSRIPVEILFDQGVGDIFVVRVAGNIAASSLIGSLEFAALNFNIPLCVVMGHTKCGAVKAAVDDRFALHVHGKESSHGRNIQVLVDEIEPAIHAAVHQHGLHQYEKSTFAELAAIENVSHTVRQIKSLSPILTDLVQSNRLVIQEAVCDISNGHVEFDLRKLQRGLCAEGVRKDELLA